MKSRSMSGFYFPTSIFLPISELVTVDRVEGNGMVLNVNPMDRSKRAVVGESSKLVLVAVGVLIHSSQLEGCVGAGKLETLVANMNASRFSGSIVSATSIPPSRKTIALE